MAVSYYRLLHAAVFVGIVSLAFQVYAMQTMGSKLGWEWTAAHAVGFTLILWTALLVTWRWAATDVQ